MDQITTLCGIEACAIIYSPNELQPQVWPPHLGVQRVLNKIKRVPETDHGMKMLIQESLILNQSIMKAQEQLKSLKNESRKKKTTLLMYQCLSSGNTIVNNVNTTNMNDL
ncbi:PREDICTED: agamous-like MADS-box protein AGL80 [Lupinus angustifolius]|uniref:agamous-like MADS-box protein AGL80 n=1 Tax=Lupinus angustifolius TaxID=3871 RepID=UPI00092F7389|nr:PREDICTED: agamous-like MADS-box protein AGL80 [Lupinus angustifolius]